MTQNPEYSADITGHLQKLRAIITTKSEIADWRKTLIELLTEEVFRLETEIASCVSYELLSQLLISQIACNPQTYKESEQTGNASTLEYVALLALKKAEVQRGVTLDSSMLQSIIQRTEEIVSATVFLLSSEQFPSPISQAEVALLDLRYRSSAAEMLSRAHGYPHHQVEYLRAIFGPINNELTANLGFDVEAFLSVEEALFNLTNEAFFRHNLRLHLSITDGEHANPDLLITFEQICGATSLDVVRVAKVLDFVSVSFGQAPSKTVLFDGRNLIRRRPILRFEAGYLYYPCRALLFCAQSAIEEAIKETFANTWNAYKDIRATFLECESIKLLKTCLRPERAYSNLTFADGKTGMDLPEIDALLIYDKTLFLVEAKSGAFDDSVDRKSSERFLRDAKKLMGKAHAQALRASAYIDSVPDPTFFDKNGEKIDVDKSIVSRRILLAVSLEPLDVLQANIGQLAEARIVGKNETPWTVSLGVLRVICEMVEFPSQFLHYLERRMLPVPRNRLKVVDELDLLADYFVNGLYYEDEPSLADPSVSHYLTTANSFIFDRFYLSEQGLAQGAIKPTQEIPVILRQAIEELETSRRPGFSEAVLLLVDWSGTARSEFASALKRVCELSRMDSRMHDCSYCGDGKGLSVVSYTGANKSNALKALQELVKRKVRYGRRWLGLLFNATKSANLKAFVLREEDALTVNVLR